MAAIHIDQLRVTGHDDDDTVFMPQRTTQDTLDLIHVSAFEASQLPHDDGRLRGDGDAPPPSLLHRRNLGLAVSAATVGVVNVIIHSVFSPLFITGYLTSSHPQLTRAATSVFSWVPVFSVVIGVVSDRCVLWDYRRKSYLLLGWLVALVALSSAAAVGYAADLTQEFTAISLITLGGVAAAGVQIVWVVSLAVTVEHAQLESERRRGHFHGAFFLVYYSATAATHFLISALVIHTAQDGSTVYAIDLRETAAILAGITALPIAFLVFFYHERHATPATASHSDTGKTMASYLHEKPAYRIYLFLVGVVFLVNAHSTSASQAILSWYGVTTGPASTAQLAQATPKVVAVFVWKQWMINLNWRVLGVFGLVLYSLCQLLLLLPYAFDVAPHGWLYYTWTAVAALPLGWVEVFLVILPTEVAGISHEGLAMGLASSFVALITLTSSTLWDSINRSLGWEFTPIDATSARATVVAVSFVYIAINISSTLLTPLLPRQKREAQRWRLFASSANRPATRALLGVFLLLLLYNLIANTLAINL